MNLIANKEGSEILFMREVDGVMKSLKYDFKTREFYSQQKSGKWNPIIQLGRFFTGIGTEEITEAFPEGAYREFVGTVLKASTKNCNASVGKKLSLLGDMLHLEGYFLEGIKIQTPKAPRVVYKSQGWYGGTKRVEEEYYGITQPVSMYQKEVRLFMKESGQTFTKNWELAYTVGEYTLGQKKVPYKDMIINLCTHIRKHYYMDLDVYKWLFNMIAHGSYNTYYKRYEAYEFNKFMQMTVRFNLEYKRLFDYLVNADRREALDFSTSLSHLQDYLSMNDQMGNTRAPRYPDNLTMRHNITARNYRVNITDPQRVKFNEVMKQWPLDWLDGRWAVVTPISPDEIKEEGQKLHHCVAQYINKVLNGTCVILFLRDFEQGADPLVTMEYNQYQNRIVQVRGQGNRDPLDDEIDAIYRFAKAKRIAYANYDPAKDVERDKNRENNKNEKEQLQHAIAA